MAAASWGDCSGGGEVFDEIEEWSESLYQLLLSVGKGPDHSFHRGTLGARFRAEHRDDPAWIDRDKSSPNNSSPGTYLMALTHLVKQGRVRSVIPPGGNNADTIVEIVSGNSKTKQINFNPRYNTALASNTKRILEQTKCKITIRAPGIAMISGPGNLAIASAEHMINSVIQFEKDRFEPGDLSEDLDTLDPNLVSAWVSKFHKFSVYDHFGVQDCDADRCRGYGCTYAHTSAERRQAKIAGNEKYKITNCTYGDDENEKWFHVRENIFWLLCYEAEYICTEVANTPKRFELLKSVSSNFTEPSEPVSFKPKALDQNAFDDDECKTTACHDKIESDASAAKSSQSRGLDAQESLLNISQSPRGADDIDMRSWSMADVIKWLERLDNENGLEIDVTTWQGNGSRLMNISQILLERMFGVSAGSCIFDAKEEILKFTKSLEGPSCLTPSSIGRSKALLFDAIDAPLPGVESPSPFPSAASLANDANDFVADFKIDFNDITPMRVVGEGISGLIVEAKYQKMDVVIKVSKEWCHEVDEEEAKGLLEKLADEGKILHSCRHPRIVPCRGIVLDEPRDGCFVDILDQQGKKFSFLWPQPGIVLDKVKNGDARTYFGSEKVGNCSLLKKLQIFEDIFEALAYLHKRKFAHRDVAARNVLLDDNLRGLLADMDRARKLKILRAKKLKEREDSLGTYFTYSSSTEQELPEFWLGPEVLRSKQHTPMSDIYMMGITMWEILSGELPYQKEMTPERGHREILVDILREASPLRPERPPILDPAGGAASKDVLQQIWDLIQQCWHPEQKKRISAVEAQFKLSYIIDRIPVDDIRLCLPDLSYAPPCAPLWESLASAKLGISQSVLNVVIAEVTWMHRLREWAASVGHDVSNALRFINQIREADRACSFERASLLLMTFNFEPVASIDFQKKHPLDPLQVELMPSAPLATDADSQCRFALLAYTYAFTFPGQVESSEISLYRLFNEALRSRIVQEVQPWWPLLYYLRLAHEKLNPFVPPPASSLAGGKRVRVFRGLKGKPFGDDVNSWSSNVALELAGFTSTSLNPQIANEFLQGAGAGIVFEMEVDCNAAKDIQKYSWFGKEEQELLITCNTTVGVKEEPIPLPGYPGVSLVKLTTFTHLSKN